MNRILRLSSLALTLVVTIALMATTLSPAQAQPQASVAAQATHPATSGAGDQGARGHEADRTLKVQPRSSETSRAGEHLKASRPEVNQIGHDYCGGWWQGPAWCLTFNKIEAGYIAAVSLSVAAAFICAGTALITCGVAVGIAAAIQRYVDRNGVCPKSRPKMRVEYIPHPGRVECV